MGTMMVLPYSSTHELGLVRMRQVGHVVVENFRGKEKERKGKRQRFMSGEPSSHKHVASERDTDFRVFRMDTITKVEWLSSINFA
jgi:hypothetical protein